MKRLKKSVSILLLTVAVLSLFTACSKQKKDLGFMLCLPNTDSSKTWTCEIMNEGIVKLLSHSAVKDDEVFLFEAVDVGKTVLTFYYCENDDKNTAVKVIEYLAEVSQDMSVKCTIVSDEIQSTLPAVSTAVKAEEAVAEQMKKDLQNADYFVITTEKEYEENGVKMYLIKASYVVKNEKGEKILKFYGYFIVDENANITKKETDEVIEDQVVFDK